MTERKLVLPVRYRSWLRSLKLDRLALEKVLADTSPGLALRYCGLLLLALAVGTSSLTFNWVIEHNPEVNFFPEFSGRVLYLSDVLMLAGLAPWALGWYLSRPHPTRYGPPYVFLPLLLLMVLTGLSIMWANDGTLAGFASTRRMLLLGIYLALVNEAHRALAPMVAVLFSVGLLHSGVAVAQLGAGSVVGLAQLGEIAQDALGYRGVGVSRAYGLGFNPNPVGAFLAAVSLLAYCLYLIRAKSRRSRALALAIGLVALLGLAATGSRSALMGWGLGGLAVTLLSWYWRKEDRRVILQRVWAVGLLLFVVAGIYLLSPSGEDGPSNFAKITGVFGRFTSGEVTGGLGIRASDLALSFPIIGESPLLGVGAGNYPIVLRQKLDPETPGGIYTPPHNVPLTIWAELGVAGFAAWLLIMAAPIIWVFQHRKSAPKGLHSMFWLGPLVVMLFEGLWDFPPWATQDGRVLMMAVLALWAGGTYSAHSSAPSQT